ncbi:MAG: hypothetical protein ABII13_05485 [Patescibacteria group bacterium]|nr:hypothetical protein [Patescibacteria group bacterium]MBU2508882.1 hypothetical protein [Patescibacteria group bacterium]
MYEKMSEPIEVLAAFKKDRTEPMVFKWGNRHYRIKKVNLVHTERRGREKIYIFSVSDEANAYRLSFSTESMKWQLEEMAVL